MSISISGCISDRFRQAPLRFAIIGKSGIEHCNGQSHIFLCASQGKLINAGYVRSHMENMCEGKPPDMPFFDLLLGDPVAESSQGITQEQVF